MIALLLSLVSGAFAHDGHVTGTFKVHSVTSADSTLTFPDALRTEGVDLVWGRWLWSFEENRVVLSSQTLTKKRDETVAKGKKQTRSADYSWCSSAVAVDIGWSNGVLLLPKMIQGESRVGRYEKAGDPVLVDECSVRLNGISSLRLIAPPPGSPDKALAMINPTGDMRFVFVPDDAKVNVSSLIDE